MKFSTIWILLIIWISLSPLYCGNIQFGIKGGLIRSDIRMIDMPDSHINLDKPDIWRHDFSAKTGINFSMTAVYSLSGSFQIVAETGYIKKGAGFTSSESKLTLDYWNLPLILKYSLSKSIFIDGGLEFSYLLKARLDDDGTIIKLDESYDNNPEISVILGIERYINKILGMGVRYNFGVTHISRTKWTDELGNIDSICREYNHYLTLYLVIYFN